MTLSDTDTAQLWETFRAGGGAELVRGAVRLVLQELIEAEVTEAVGAGRYERSDARVNERNGHRPRLLATQAGDVELRIPKLARARCCRRCSSLAGASIGPCTRSSWRPMWPGCPPDRWMIWWPLWARSRGYRSRRCRASARGSTRWWRRSGAGASITSSSPTSMWTRPISRCATASRRSSRWRWSWPPASPPTATARSWDATSATARARGSGRASWARCEPAGSQACAW